MISDIRKEIKFSTRTGKLLIIFASVCFFAIFTPLMTKYVAPEIMKSQFPGMTEEVLNQMLDFTQIGNIAAFMGDLFQIIPIVIAFAFGGVLASEIKDNTLVLPLCSGKRFLSVISSKIIVIGTILFTAPIVASEINFYYTGILFIFDVSFVNVMVSGILYGLYFVFLLSLILMWGAFTKNNIATGFLTLATSLQMYFLANAFELHEYLPTGLINQAEIALGEIQGVEILKAVLVFILFVVIVLSITMIKLSKREWNER